MLNLSFDKKFEDILIKDFAKEVYEDCHNHAERRSLETDYVIDKFIKEFSILARKDGYVK